MRRDAIYRILSAIGEGVGVISDLMIGFLRAGYGASANKITRKIEEQTHRRHAIQKRITTALRARQVFYTLLYQLRKEGLIKNKEGSELDKKVFLTTKGWKKLYNLRLKKLCDLPDSDYPSRKGYFTVISFDIPERERKKRNWLRLVLRKLGLHMVQKSVFVGNTKIPKELLYDLKKLRILECVQIFQVSKKGSLHRTDSGR